MRASNQCAGPVSATSAHPNKQGSGTERNRAWFNFIPPPNAKSMKYSLKIEIKYYVY